jgi:hypothetical protein
LSCVSRAQKAARQRSRANTRRSRNRSIRLIGLRGLRCCGLLRGRGLLAEPGAVGGCRYYVSDSTDDFARLAGLFMGAPVTDAVERVSLE